MAASLSRTVLGAALALQAGAFYAVAARADLVPSMEPLAMFPRTLNQWVMAREFPLEKEVQEVLRADDTMNRVYVAPGGAWHANLFIAYFKTQRYGQAPHSPKNCLPGSGWQPLEDRKLPVSIPGRDTPIVVNKYMIARGEEKSVVLYWYQSHKRAIAGELAAKFWLVADAIKERRSDTALVRILVPVQSAGPEAAENTAVEFLRVSYPTIVSHLPQ